MYAHVRKGGIKKFRLVVTFMSVIKSLTSKGLLNEQWIIILFAVFIYLAYIMAFHILLIEIKPGK